MADEKKPERTEHTNAYWRMLEQRLEASLDRAPTYKSYNEVDRDAIRWIWDMKKQQGELGDLANDFFKGIEEVALLYKNQKCAFEDVLTKEGFEPTQEVLRDYPGRIAVLTYHGTLMVMSKPNEEWKRHIRTTRIHTPKFDYTGARAFLENDLKINGEGPRIVGYSCHSQTRALAINPRGADGDELEERVYETLFKQLEVETFKGSVLGKSLGVEIPNERVVEV